MGAGTLRALQDGLSGEFSSSQYTDVRTLNYKSPSLPSIRRGAADITQADCRELPNTPVLQLDWDQDEQENDEFF